MAREWVKRLFAARPHAVPALVAAALLLAALGRWLYDYYRVHASAFGPRGCSGSWPLFIAVGLQFASPHRSA